MLSMSSFDADSFVSAQDTVADLKDFEDLNDILQVLKICLLSIRIIC